MMANRHAQAMSREKHKAKELPQCDLWLSVVALALIGIGLVMVASASISIAERRELPQLYYFWRQLASVSLGGSLVFVLFKVPLKVWDRLSTPLLFTAILALIVVLVPSLGHEVNGSMRWIKFGSISLQASEPMKLAVIIYLASYLVRHREHVRNEFVGFIKPIGVLTIIAALLLLEPDFGAAAVLFGTALGMLFLGGVPLVRFFAWGVVAISALMTLTVLAPYRLQRLMTFMDPWADPYASGFQLTQALIAFGRGEWFGVGLGNSVQKLFYLPEVHTDFVFAVVAEELGVVGAVLIVVLFTFLVLRIFQLGGAAERREQIFAAYLIYGVGLLLGAQAFINMGVNMGLLPTKGLPLPLLSYGSNNIVVTCAGLGIVLRAAYETRFLSDTPRSEGPRYG
ncbi:MAG: putative lipid II flippase FtsW [Pseudomonadota bacterium]